MAVDINVWLERLGLGKYADRFAENEIDFDAARDLTEEVGRLCRLPSWMIVKLSTMPYP